MNCKDLEPLLASLGEGSLSPAEERRARAHLEGCGTCRAALARRGKLEQLLGTGLAVPDPGEAYFKAQRLRILQSAASPSSAADSGAPAAPARIRRPSHGRYAWAAAAAILILAVGAATYFGVPGLGARTPATASGPAVRPPGAPALPRPEIPPVEGIPEAQRPILTAQKPPPPLTRPAPEAGPAVAGQSAVPKVAPERTPTFGSGTSARLAAMTEEAVDIGLAETPRERVVALFGAAEARLGELGQVIRQDPNLASELAGAYLLLLGEGVKGVLTDASESPQEIALARLAARERARGHESTLLELGAVAQGKLRRTLDEALAMSRDLSRP